MREVVPALKAFIEGKREFINSFLSPFDLEFGKVFEFETEVVSLDEMPCIMIGNGSDMKRWVAEPYLIEVRYEIEMLGYLTYDDNEINARALKAFSHAFSAMWEFKSSEEIPIEGRPYVIHYHSEVPCDEGRLEYQWLGETFCRQFNRNWHGWITRNTFDDVLFPPA